MAAEPHVIYIGYDKREQAAYNVAKYSIEKHTDYPVRIIPLIKQDLIERKIYRRGVDPMASTDFTFLQFYIPLLQHYEGTALFIDCDFVITRDINELFCLAEKNVAASVVQHNYVPRNSLKMDGKVQAPLPRKNWASCLLWNCGHPSNRRLDSDFLNTSDAGVLYRFEWLKDEEIGSLPVDWNFLVGEYELADYGFSEQNLPGILHYTLGGPWFEHLKDCPLASVWNKYYKEECFRHQNEHKTF